MATVNKDSKGWRVLVVMPDGQRKTIRLTGLNKSKAEQVGRHVDELVQAKGSGQPMDRQTSLWLAEIGQKLHDKLSRAGLVEQRVNALLGDFVAAYIKRRSDVKPGTVTNYDQVRLNLVAFFGYAKPMRSVTASDAAAFREWLLSAEGLAENTARRRCGRSRQFFTAAMKAKLIDNNPFDGLPVSVGGNKAKERFVTEEQSQKILDACPDAEWRLIFALCRYGGLRCPSEVLKLKWTDILRDQDRIIVPSPKTAHYEGHESRNIPMFPELQTALQDVYDQMAENTAYVITRYRSSNQNLRTTFTAIIKRAGVVPWAKPFQNLRSTRETELMETYPAHVVCRWIGNSEAVAKKHYLQVTDAHFEKAVAKKVAHPVAQSESV
jgi:integrase